MGVICDFMDAVVIGARAHPCKFVRSVLGYIIWGGDLVPVTFGTNVLKSEKSLVVSFNRSIFAER